jgi:predicted Zn-ribbon and HTH transcriptional regulator
MANKIKKINPNRYTIEAIAEFVREQSERDYTEFTNIDTPQEQRRKFDVGDIYMNSGRCTECGWHIRSKNRHHMATCKCGACSIDGGSWYIKSSGPIELSTVLYNDRREEDETII